MRIFNENKTEEIFEYDKTKGLLFPDKLFVTHHEAVGARAEEGHYETVATYPNGGKTVEWVVDSSAIDACEAWDEYEDIYVFKPYTEAELAKSEIAELKQRLAASDYQAIKYAEGHFTDEEYAPIKAERQAWRNRINELEALIAAGGAI